MCLILLAETNRLTDEELEQAAHYNRDGLGIMWCQNGRVHWRKSITLAKAKKLARSVPMPYVLHARLATHGGRSNALCHPFPIDKGARMSLSGSSAIGAVMHNGMLNLKNELYAGLRDPVSDSRAITRWIAMQPDLYAAIEHLSTVFRDRLAIMTPNKIYLTGQWHQVRDGVRASNQGYLRSIYPAFDDDDFSWYRDWLGEPTKPMRAMDLWASPEFLSIDKGGYYED